MNLRQMNDQGIEQFRDYLTSLREAPATPLPSELLDDPRFTELVEPNVSIDDRRFSSKFEAGEYLRLQLSPVPILRLRADVGIWCWLAIWFFDQLCPVDGRNRRKPLDNPKYIAQPGDHRFGLDKHLLFFPWKMCMLHGRPSRYFLAEPLARDTRAQREWTSYNFNVSTPLIELAANIYGDGASGSLRRGAMGKKPGNLRDFMRILKQLEVTYDIHGMSANEIMKLLPRRQFAKWIDLKAK